MVINMNEDYIKPCCCMCGKPTKAIKKKDYDKSRLYFCGLNNALEYNKCIREYWRQLHEQYIMDRNRCELFH